MQRGELCLAVFPFADSGQVRVRPVLLLTGPVGHGNEILAAYISSVLPEPLQESDLILGEGEEERIDAGLKTQSVVRLHKIATIHVNRLRRSLGALTPVRMDEAAGKLAILLGIQEGD